MCHPCRRPLGSQWSFQISQGYTVLSSRRRAAHASPTPSRLVNSVGSCSRLHPHSMLLMQLVSLPYVAMGRLADAARSFGPSCRRQPPQLRGPHLRPYAVIPGLAFSLVRNQPKLILPNRVIVHWSTWLEGTNPGSPWNVSWAPPRI